MMVRQGETVITDGKITARSRCGNHVKKLRSKRRIRFGTAGRQV